MSKPTLKIFSALFIAAAFVIVSASSCKGTPDCGAYQGSKKSVRSFSPKGNHHHAQVISNQVSKEL